MPSNFYIIGDHWWDIKTFTYRPVCIVKFISENNSDPLEGFLSSEPGRHTSIYYNSYTSITFSIQSKGVLNVNLSIKRTNFKWPSMQRWQCPAYNATLETLSCCRNAQVTLLDGSLEIILTIPLRFITVAHLLSVR